MKPKKNMPMEEKKPDTEVASFSNLHMKLKKNIPMEKTGFCHLQTAVVCCLACAGKCPPSLKDVLPSLYSDNKQTLW